MDCPICGESLIIEDKVIAEYIHCENCNYEEIEYSVNGKCCIAPEIIPVRDYLDEIDAFQNNDIYRVYNQCQHCGKRIGTGLKKKDYNKNDLPQFRKDLEEIVKETQNDLIEISKRINERKVQSKQTDFWIDYDEYLKSERWQEITKIILKRDNYLCQSCLYEKATVVHHTEGRYRKNEPLFTLISLCSRCHDIITEIDRGNYEKVGKIKYEFDKRIKNVW
jgi:5-methylcytosine-specific restriction endonuclease McrA